MKFAPEKKTEIQIPQPLSRVREELAKAAAEKRQRDTSDPAYRPFFGKVTETGFKLSPNTGHRSGYSPVIEGGLTEVTESKPGEGESDGVTRIFTRISTDMQVRPLMKFFSVFWLVLCVIILGLAIWICFKNGFENRWWLLLIGPALFLIERIICGISFRSNAKKAENMIKKLFK